MSTDPSTPPDQGTDKNRSPTDQGNDESSSSKRRARAYVWTFFEKITGEDGLPKTRCTVCKKVYSTAPKSGTSTMRRHLRKCCPQPLTQFNPAQPVPCANAASSSDDMAEEVRTAKKLKSVMVDDIQSKTDRELVEFIWMNKRNVGILEEKLPEKARALKETIRCYEDEIDRRAKLQIPKENGQGHLKVPLKVEAVDEDDELVAQFENVGETHTDVNQQNTCPQADSGKPVIKLESSDQSVIGNDKYYENIAEEERAGRLQIVAMNGYHNKEEEPPTRETAISLPQDICADLREVSSVLSMLTSPNSSYTPQGNPLDQEAENAKQTLTQLLKEDFESIVKSSELKEKVKSCIQILTENLHKLPKCQGRVIEALNTEFESACESWKSCSMNIQTNIAWEVQQGENLKVLQEWQEKDVELESEISEVDKDIVRLKNELRERESTREKLVKRKSDLFDQSKISIDEAKKLLQDMVSAKLQSDVAIDNMKEVAKKWERNREKFKIK